MPNPAVSTCPRSILLLGWVLILLAFARSAQADGCVFPLEKFGTTPAIRGQSALIVHRNNVEELTIQSSFTGQGDDFGWVIPLPVKPTRFARGSDDLLPALAQVSRPILVTSENLRTPLTLWIVAAASLLAIALFSLAAGGLSYRGLMVGFMLMIPVCIGAYQILRVYSYSYPYSKVTAAQKSPGVTIEHSEEVGDYTVEVLRADSAAALGDWLQQNGYKRPSPKANSTVEQLIRENWCFVAAKLRQTATELKTPHPIALAFNSTRIIYPMRLTAESSTPVDLTVFVIAAQEATFAKLRKEYCGVYAPDAGFPYKQNYYLLYLMRKIKSGASVWDGCVMTRLAGTIRPEEMTQDFYFDLKTTQPYCPVYYTYEAALSASRLWGLWTWCVLVGAGLFLLAASTKHVPGRWFFRRHITAFPHPRRWIFRILALFAWLAWVVQSLAQYHFLGRMGP